MDSRRAIGSVAEMSPSALHEAPTSCVVPLGRRDPSAPLLICFPEAGRGATAFDRLLPHLTDVFDVLGIQLPGREARHREAPYTSMQVAAGVVASELEPHITRAFVVLGQSLGTILAFEVMRRLRPAAKDLARALIGVSEHAPHRHSKPSVPGHLLDDEQFLGDPARVGEANPMHRNPELRELMLPTYRADCMLLETYTYVAGPPLDVAFTAVLGADEYCGAAEELVRSWQEVTTGPLRIVRLAQPGKPFEAGDESSLEQIAAQLVSAAR